MNATPPPHRDRPSADTLWKELRGVVERITYQNAENGFTVARLATERPGTEIVRRSIEKVIERKRSEVAGDEASPLERLLAERVALCWVAAMYADAEYTRKLKEGMSFREGEYYSKRCEQTNRQLLKAIESLARVRRLFTPMQVNTGHNQINLSK